MNYEQKYNEILEWARKNKARLNGVPIEEVLPELRESEEERIRKWLYDYFFNIGASWIHPEFSCEQILAWLKSIKPQKQGNNISISPERLKELRDQSFEDGRKAGIAEMAKSMPMPEDTVLFQNGVKEGRRLEREEMWKPSEEKLSAFASYIEELSARAKAAVGGWEKYDALINLYEDLKKL